MYAINPKSSISRSQSCYVVGDTSMVIDILFFYIFVVLLKKVSNLMLWKSVIFLLDFSLCKYVLWTEFKLESEPFKTGKISCYSQTKRND